MFWRKPAHRTFTAAPKTELELDTLALSLSIVPLILLLLLSPQATTRLLDKSK